MFASSEVSKTPDSGLRIDVIPRLPPVSASKLSVTSWMATAMPKVVMAR